MKNMHYHRASSIRFHSHEFFLPSIIRNFLKLPQCVVKIGGIFTLTAFMNHSCGPNAEIRGQEYVDCNIDVVAKEDISRGEEICISYSNLGANPSYSVGAKNQRRKELSSRYLFHCQCFRCVERKY